MASPEGEQASAGTEAGFSEVQFKILACLLQGMLDKVPQGPWPRRGHQWRWRWGGLWKWKHQQGDAWRVGKGLYGRAVGPPTGVRRIGASCRRGPQGPRAQPAGQLARAKLQRGLAGIKQEATRQEGVVLDSISLSIWIKPYTYYLVTGDVPLVQ